MYNINYLVMLTFDGFFYWNVFRVVLFSRS